MTGPESSASVPATSSQDLDIASLAQLGESILKLPTEIRLIILGYVLKQSSLHRPLEVKSRGFKNDTYSIILGPITTELLRPGSPIHHEAVQIFYGDNFFLLEDAPTVYKFLDFIGSTGRAHIKRISLSVSSKNLGNRSDSAAMLTRMALDLVLRDANKLQKLYLHFESYWIPSGVHHWFYKCAWRWLQVKAATLEGGYADAVKMVEVLIPDSDRLQLSQELQDYIKEWEEKFREILLKVVEQEDEGLSFIAI